MPTLIRVTFVLLCVAGLAGFAQSAALAPRTGVFVGTVGRYPIVMQIARNGDGDYSGAYFYERAHLDLPFEGMWRDGQLRLSTQNHSPDDLVLTPTKDGYLGTLHTHAGRSFGVRLHGAAPVAARDLPDGADTAQPSDPYERQRLKGLRLQAQKAEVIGGRHIRWYVEPVTDMRLFRIESGYPAPIMAKINHGLSVFQWSAIAEAFGCAGYDGRPGVSGGVQAPPFLSNDYVSIAWSSEWSCMGAAHPDFGTSSISFDAHSGRELRLADLLWFGGSKPPATDKAIADDYASAIFAPRLVALLQSLYPRHMAANDNDCDYTDPGVWDAPSWYLTPKGLYVGAYFPRAARVCDSPEWSVIPYARLTALRHRG